MKQLLITYITEKQLFSGGVFYEIMISYEPHATSDAIIKGNHLKTLIAKTHLETKFSHVPAENIRIISSIEL